jgi:hypothetical protein
VQQLKVITSHFGHLPSGNYRISIMVVQTVHLGYMCGCYRLGG